MTESGHITSLGQLGLASRRVAWRKDDYLNEHLYEYGSCHIDNATDRP
jgi:hypothetical protein